MSYEIINCIVSGLVAILCLGPPILNLIFSVWEIISEGRR